MYNDILNEIRLINRKMILGLAKDSITNSTKEIDDKVVDMYRKELDKINGDLINE